MKKRAPQTSFEAETPGTCAVCGHPYAKGDLIGYSRRDLGGHELCVGTRNRRLHTNTDKRDPWKDAS